MIFIRASISIIKELNFNFDMLIKILERVREMKLILIFPIETTNSLSVFLLISVTAINSKLF